MQRAKRMSVGTLRGGRRFRTRTMMARMARMATVRKTIWRVSVRVGVALSGCCCGATSGDSSAQVPSASQAYGMVTSSTVLPSRVTVSARVNEVCVSFGMKRPMMGTTVSSVARSSYCVVYTVFPSVSLRVREMVYGDVDVPMRYAHVNTAFSSPSVSG
jgi:hypothetical protein